MFLFFLSLFSLPQASADEDDTAGVTMKIPTICKLTVNDSDQILNLFQDASGEEAYEQGYIDGDLGKPRLIVDSNTDWRLSVKVYFDWSAVDTYQKETGDLKLKVASRTGHQTGFSDFTSLSLNEQEIASYDSGSGDDMYDCKYRILLDWEKDIPGSYFIIITYTLSTQSR